MKLDDLDWDDLRVFAVALRSQSYRDAAAQLGMTHPTVRRRLASLEAATGFRLFQRGEPGLQPTREGRELLEAAAAVESAVASFARQARSARAPTEGPITVSLAVSMAVGLAPAIAEFVEAWPDVLVTLDTRRDFVDLAALEADVAIRAYARGNEADPSLAGRCAASVNQAIYGLPGVKAWIASAADPDWVRRTPFPDLPVRLVVPDAVARLEACRLGIGLAELPCIQADPHLPRLSAPEHGYDIWVLVHPDMRHNPRHKRLRDAMVDALRARSELLAGVPPKTRR